MSSLWRSGDQLQQLVGMAVPEFVVEVIKIETPDLVGGQKDALFRFVVIASVETTRKGQLYLIWDDRQKDMHEFYPYRDYKHEKGNIKMYWYAVNVEISTGYSTGKAFQQFQFKYNGKIVQAPTLSVGYNVGFGRRATVIVSKQEEHEDFNRLAGFSRVSDYRDLHLKKQFYVSTSSVNGMLTVKQSIRINGRKNLDFCDIFIKRVDPVEVEALVFGTIPQDLPDRLMAHFFNVYKCKLVYTPVLKTLYKIIFFDSTFSKDDVKKQLVEFLDFEKDEFIVYSANGNNFFQSTWLNRNHKSSVVIYKEFGTTESIGFGERNVSTDMLESTAQHKADGFKLSPPTIVDNKDVTLPEIAINALKTRACEAPVVFVFMPDGDLDRFLNSLSVEGDQKNTSKIKAVYKKSQSQEIAAAKRYQRLYSFAFTLKPTELDMTQWEFNMQRSKGFRSERPAGEWWGVDEKYR